MVCGFRIGKAAKRPGSAVRGSALWLMLAPCLVCGGCDSESFVPSRPAELAGPAAAVSTRSSPAAAGPNVAAPRPGSTAVGARALELIVAPRGEIESEVMKGSARMQAGSEKVRLQVS